MAGIAAAWRFAGNHIHGGVSKDAGQIQRAGFGKDQEEVCHSSSLVLKGVPVTFILSEEQGPRIVPD